MAPEVRANFNKNNIPYNPFKADIYSLGVLFCEIVGNDSRIKNEVDKLKGKTQLESIIRNCLQEDPMKRNHISEIQQTLKQMNE